MIKRLFCVMVAVVALFATSCQNEVDFGANANETSVVSFSLATPRIATRYGEGYSATQLQYAVYSISEDKTLNYLETLGGTEPDFNGSTTITLPLVTGSTYQVVFWASNPKAPYKLDAANAKINVKYTNEDGGANVLSNQEIYDAFFGATDQFKVEHAMKKKVVLTRPFAQLNIGTTEKDYTDAENAGLNLATTSVKVPVYSTLNLITGDVENEIEEGVVFDAANLPAEDFLVAGHKYVAMNYLLVNEKEVVDVVLTCDSFTREFNSIPLQRNHRTNIFGSLFTADVDFNIEVEPEFTGVFVSDPAELAAAVKQSGTVILVDDITPETTIDIKADVDVHLDLNGKNIVIDPEVLTPNSNGSHYAFIVREGGSLVIDGDGTVEATTPAPIFFYPAGDLVIENGTFIRNMPEGYTGDVGSMFIGTRPSGGWESTGVTIKGGYFDCGYYPAELKEVDIDKLITGEATLVETESDIATRGKPGDTNVIRKTIKELISVAFNRSYNYFYVYGGTFVGANPAWGDEGCRLPTTPNYLRPWSNNQGSFIEGQEDHADGIVLPEGYTITKDAHEDGRPTYTVTYVKPDNQ